MNNHIHTYFKINKNYLTSVYGIITHRLIPMQYIIIYFEFL